MLKLLSLLLLATARPSTGHPHDKRPSTRETNGTIVFLRYVNITSISDIHIEGCGLNDDDELKADELITFVGKRSVNGESSDGSSESVDKIEVSGVSGDNEDMSGISGSSGGSENGGTGGSGGSGSESASGEETATEKSRPNDETGKDQSKDKICPWNIFGFGVTIAVSCIAGFVLAYCFLDSAQHLEDALEKVAELKETIKDTATLLEDSELNNTTPLQKAKIDKAKERLQQGSEVAVNKKWRVLAWFTIGFITLVHTLVAYDVDDIKKKEIIELYTMAVGSAGFVGISGAIWVVCRFFTEHSHWARNSVLLVSAGAVLLSSFEMVLPDKNDVVTNITNPMSPVMLTARQIFVGVSMSSICTDHLGVYGEQKFSVLLFLIVGVAPLYPLLDRFNWIRSLVPVAIFGRFDFPWFTTIAYVLAGIIAAALSHYDVPQPPTPAPRPASAPSASDQPSASASPAPESTSTPPASAPASGAVPSSISTQPPAADAVASMEESQSTEDLDNSPGNHDGE